MEVSVPELVSGNLAIETESCSLSVQSPPVLIDQNQACLDYLGLGQLF